jgi:methylated-DNA-[protein]-cysteine S-methyltransferase
MSGQFFSLFDSDLGRCGIAWSARGLIGVQLPEARERDTRARMRARFPDAAETPPPPLVQQWIGDIVSLLHGGKPDLTKVVLDMSGVPAFYQLVYDVVGKIPPGETMTYGEIAQRVGEPGAARAVGQAMGHNPFPIVVPCHRVLAAQGLGGFSAPGGALTKRRMLEIEGARLQGELAL